MTDLSSLARFRKEPAPEPAASPEWEWLPLRVLAFDQALAATGWAVVSAVSGTPGVQASGTLTTVSETKGPGGTVVRAAILYRQVVRLLDLLAEPDLVVYETPPVGPKMSRPESSMAAAVAIACACVNTDESVRMIAAQRAKKVLTGNANADKREVHERVATLVALPSRTNANVRDAIALALVALRK